MNADPNRPIIFIGTSGWTYRHWKGDFYPVDLPQRRWFEYYSRHFQAVEVNATFYRPFSPEVYQKWNAISPGGFRFFLKVPKIISHQKLLINTTSDIQEFCASTSGLGEKLSGYLLLVSPQMPYDLQVLTTALEAFDDPSRVAVEFRHPQWDNSTVQNILKEHHTALVSVDSPQAHLADGLTGSFAYLRLHGHQEWYASSYTSAELKKVGALAHRLLDQGAQSVYIFFNNDLGGHAPRNAAELFTYI
jgi:uncharacterized protein YecE (DUF72 family)